MRGEFPPSIYKIGGIFKILGGLVWNMKTLLTAHKQLYLCLLTLLLLFDFFECLILPSVKHNPKHNASFTKAELDSSSAHHKCPYIISMQPINEAIRGILKFHKCLFLAQLSQLAHGELL